MQLVDFLYTQHIYKFSKITLANKWIGDKIVAFLSSTSNTKQCIPLQFESPKFKKKKNTKIGYNSILTKKGKRFQGKKKTKLQNGMDGITT